MSFELGATSTKMLDDDVKGPQVIRDVRRVTNGCLRDIGRESLTYGAFVHEIAMGPLLLAPRRFI